jgi:hypothetical protein
MGDPGASSLVVARLVALYLLSVLAVASADLAWGPPRPLRVAADAVLPGLALVLGSFLTEALSAVGSAGVRRRIRVFALVLVPLPTLLASLVAWGVPAVGADVTSHLVVLQIAVLLLAEALDLELLALWGALVLAIVASAGGGLPGPVALTGLLAFAGVFFALDHAAARLVLWPGTPAPPLGVVLGDTLRLVAPPVVLLGAAFVAFPLSPAPSAAPLAARGPFVSSAPDVHRAYVWLVLLALGGTGALILVFRWLRGRERGDRPLVELAESHVEAEEALEPPAPFDPRYAAARGRVIRAYLRFLGQARAVGFRIGPSLTPREIEGRVRRPKAALDHLTGLFMDARYGPDEPAPDTVHEAEAASRAVCAGLLHRRRAARRAARSAAARRGRRSAS